MSHAHTPDETPPVPGKPPPERPPMPGHEPIEDPPPPGAPPPVPPQEPPPGYSMRFTVNGAAHALQLEPRRTLLDALRHELGLTGTKKACDMGNCGACTVLVDGRAVYACLLLALECEGQAVETIESLKDDPLQRAFIEADAFQCGFCTPGQIMSLKGLLRHNPAPSDEDIVRAVSGNLCRCGAYRNIVRAARIAAGG